MLFGSLISFIRVFAFFKTAHRTQGKIIKLVEKSIRGGNSDTFPVFSFITTAGQEITVTQKANRPRFKAGASVEVLYDPQNPQDAKIDSWMNFYFFPTLTGIIALATGLTAILALL